MSAAKKTNAEGNATNGAGTCFLLNDLPASADVFGTHEKIAAAIYHLTTFEPGGKAIALKGTWGGGKSTVINLLKRNAASADKDKPKLNVFVFDAWSHEGDPLKRSFLEKLISYLKEQKCISGDKWDQRIAQLARRYKETTTTNSPQLTSVGTICGLLLFVVAIGLAMIGSGIEHKAWNAVGFFLTLSLPFFLLIYWIIKKFLSPKDKRGDTNNLLGYLANKQVEKTKTSTTEDADPTSIEFQACFFEIAEEALKNNQRLLIAIDNLDRIAPDDALKLWAAMRTFVDFSDTQTPQWAQNLWVLVAFDENGIKRLWNTDNGTDCQNTQSIASTFLDKTFQISFRIPAPLLSNWQEFLKHQLQKAFPDVSIEEFYKVGRIFAILRAEKTSPTPRVMKVFVNQVGAVVRTSPDVIPLPEQALYALLIESNWDPTKEIPELQRMSAYVGQDCQKNLTALFYGMPRDKAILALLGDRVERALTEGDPLMLDRPEMGYIVAHVLEQRLPNWMQNEPHMIGHAANALSAPSMKDNFSVIVAKKRLFDGMRGVEIWPRLDRICGMGLSLLLKQSENPQDSIDLIKKLSKHDSIIQKTEISENNIGNWVVGIEPIVDFLVKSGHEDIVTEYLRVGHSSEVYATIASSLNLLANTHYIKYFRPAIRELEVVEYINANYANLRKINNPESAILSMLNVECDWPWNSLTRLGESIQSPGKNDEDEIGVAIRILLLLRKETTFAEDQLQEIMRSGWLFFKLGVAKINGDENAFAACIVYALLYDPDYTQGGRHMVHIINGRQLSTQNGINEYSNWLNSPTDSPALLESVVNLLIRLNALGDLLSMSAKFSARMVVYKTLLEAFAKDPNSHLHYTPELLITKYNTLNSCLKTDSLDSLISNAIEKYNFEIELINAEFSLEAVGLYRKTLMVRHSVELTKKIIAGIKSLTKEIWAECLYKEGDIFSLLEDLHKLAIPIGVGLELQDALSEFSEHLISNEIPDHLKPEICEMLVSSLTSSQAAVFKKNLRDKIIAAEESTTNLLLLFPNILMDCETLCGKLDDLIRQGFRKILERKDSTEYEWIKKVLQNCKKVQSTCPAETWQDFTMRIRAVLKEPNEEECKLHLIEIKRICNIQDDSEMKAE